MQEKWKTRGNCHVFGNDIAHDNMMMPWKHIIGRQTDPDILIPDLLVAIDPEFPKKVKPGDFLIAGHRFGCGKGHTNAYIAMEALGMRILCESTFDRVIRGAINLGVPILSTCNGVTNFLKSGDEIEVDVSTGDVVRLATGERRSYPPIPRPLQQVLREGGRKGFLEKWLNDHPELGKNQRYQL